VIVNLAEAANETMFTALGGLMNGGDIELLTDGGSVLTVLKLSSPAARIEDGVLEFNEISEGIARVQGNVRSARIVTKAGEEIFSCDVGYSRSDACIKLNTVWVAAGGPIKLSSFVLAMP
jgi:hypothetical protein